ncbi:hypothetical protein C8A01DRAFT_40831 [Parachaetomium inaequale]|uniref:Uncharacterized protein n=1 Tax=Parachaetomium inaequale TaxID=2588326 RepID=A0AAN6P6L9_9PEZI|nr:hypothetical protein C8A01DRAFT_40831 [Parachaetomium inaequale]
MKIISVLACLAALAMAAPAPADRASLKVRGTDEMLALEKRGCPAGYSCQSGKCYQYTCSSSGWCSLSPTSLTC